MSISEWSKVTHQDSYLWFNLRHVHIRIKIRILYIWIKLCILPIILYSLKLYLYLNIYILYPTYYPVPLYLYDILFCILLIILYPLYLYLNIYILYPTYYSVSTVSTVSVSEYIYSVSYLLFCPTAKLSKLFTNNTIQTL